MEHETTQDIDQTRRRKKLPEPKEYSQLSGTKFRSKTGSVFLAAVLANINSLTNMSILH